MNDAAAGLQLAGKASRGRACARRGRLHGREGPSVETFTNGGQCRRLGTWLGSSRVQGFVGEWTRRLYSLPKAIDDVSANAPPLYDGFM